MDSEKQITDHDRDKRTTGLGDNSQVSLKQGYDILVVEDNMTNQQVAIGILQKLGQRADAVSDGNEAFKALKENPYDLVLMDIQMPVMDGLETTRHIRNPNSGVLDPNIPIIAMTAYALDGDEERCLAAGMNDYVFKPVEPQLLAEKMQHWLKLKPACTSRKKAKRSDPEKQVGFDQALFNRDDLLNRLIDDDELALRIISAYLDDTPQRLQLLKHFVAIEDFQGICRQAHAMKGAAGNISSEKIQKLAQEIERLAKKRDLETIQEHVDQLERLYPELKEILLNSF